MARPIVGRCPSCQDPLEVARLECRNCGTAVEGRFDLCRFCRLSQEQQRFVEVFLVARGNIKEVERVLGISYPTVRGRLEAVLEALGHQVQRDDTTVSAGMRREILGALDKGEITPAEAINRLKG